MREREREIVDRDCKSVHIRDGTGQETGHEGQGYRLDRLRRQRWGQGKTEIGPGTEGGPQRRGSRMSKRKVLVRAGEGEERRERRGTLRGNWSCQPGVRAQWGRSCQEPELTPRGDLTGAQGKQNPELPQKDPERHPKGEGQRQFPVPPPPPLTRPERRC